jgi:hypothetical protein
MAAEISITPIKYFQSDLRMTKVKQKISGCFRTEKYAKAYCRISNHTTPAKRVA